MILIGTKCDLKDDPYTIANNERRKTTSVTKGEGEKLARKIGALGYFETSGYTGQGTTKALDAILDYALKSRRKHNSLQNENAFSCLFCCCHLCSNKDGQ